MIPLINERVFTLFLDDIHNFYRIMRNMLNQYINKELLYKISLQTRKQFLQENGYCFISRP